MVSGSNNKPRRCARSSCGWEPKHDKARSASSSTASTSKSASRCRINEMPGRDIGACEKQWFAQQLLKVRPRRVTACAAASLLQHSTTAERVALFRGRPMAANVKKIADLLGAKVVA